MTQIVQRPFMPPTRDAVAAENHRSLMRMLFATMVAGKGKYSGEQSAEAIISKHWSGDTNAALITRSAVTPTSTTNSGLPMLAGSRLLSSIAPGSAGEQTLARAGMVLDFAKGQQFILPYYDMLPPPIWVNELGAFPVVVGSTGELICGPPSKMGFMLKYTNELGNYAIEDGFALFSRMMTETARPALDKALLGTAAATSKSQAGLLWNVTPLPATPGGGLDALVGDLKQMAGAMATALVTSDGAIIVAHPEQVEGLNALPPQPLKHDVYGPSPCRRKP